MALNVDLIMTISNPPAIAARRASAAIPIVVIDLYLPVESGLVASLARPSGNITGTMFPAPQTQAKNLQILQDAFPDARRVARLTVTAQAGSSQYDSAVRQVASALGIALTILPCNSVAEIETALAQVEREPPDALSRADHQLFSTPSGARCLQRVLRRPSGWADVLFLQLK